MKLILEKYSSDVAGFKKKDLNMELVRLIYVSTMTESCDTAALQDILAASKRNNMELGISGVLCYDPAFFMQCLEGPRDAVNEVYSRIYADPRHKDITLLEYVESDTRLFANWTMGFLRTDMLDKSILEKYGAKGRVTPRSLSAEQARNFLLDIAEFRRKQLAGQ